MIGFVTRAVAASVFATAAISSASASNLVLNGEFSSFSGAHGSTITDWATGGNGGTSGNGYGITATTSPNIQYNASFPTTPGGASTAAYFVDDNANPETLEQTLNLTVGQTYELSFSLLEPLVGAGNPNGFTLTPSIGTKTFTSVNSPLPTGQWVTETDYFTATAKSELLEFAFFSGPSTAQDLFLSDVNVSATPLPSSAALLFPAFAAFGLLAWRRKSKDHSAFLAA